MAVLVAVVVVVGVVVVSSHAPHSTGHKSATAAPVIGSSHASLDAGHSKLSNSPLQRSRVIVVIVVAVVVEVVASQLSHKTGHFSIKVDPKMLLKQSWAS